MGAHPGDCQDNGAFTLSSHLNDNQTDEKQLDKILNIFCVSEPGVPKTSTSSIVPNNPTEIGKYQRGRYPCYSKS